MIGWLQVPVIFSWVDAHISSEVIGMEEEYDEQADIFSFGCVMVELITRKLPPLRIPQENYAFPIEKFRTTIRRDVPPPFVNLALHCVQFKPQDRPTALQVLEALCEIDTSFPYESP